MNIDNIYYTVEYLHTVKGKGFQTFKHGEYETEFESRDILLSKEFYTEEELKEFLTTTHHDIESVRKIIEYSNGDQDEEDYDLS
jgi:hypothetical protein